MHIPRTTVQAKSHRFKNLAILIYVMVTAGMGGMFITVYLGLPVVISMLALVVPMFLIAGLTSGKTEYVIDGRFLEKKLVTFLRKQRIDNNYSWSDVTGFKEGKDMNRSYEEYSYLEVYFKDRTTWQITDQVDKAGFGVFKDNFYQAVNLNNQTAAVSAHTQLTGGYAHAAGTSQSNVITTSESHPVHTIIQKKTFYETVWAKVFFWAMALFVSGIWGFLILNPQYRSFTTGFRLTFVIIPGMLYLYYRIYVKRM